MFPNHMWGYGWWGMLLGVVMMLLFWGAIIALAVFAIRAIVRSNRTGGDNAYSAPRLQTPLEILKERYARGEITRDEYVNMRRDLEE